MKVLFITTDYYPDMGTTTNLLKKLFFDGGLKAQVGELGVLTLKRRYEEPEEETVDGVRVYRALAWHFLPKREIRAALSRNPLDALRGAVKKVHFKGQASGFIHEDTCGALVAMLKKIHAERYDVLVPVFGMFDSVAAVMDFAGETSQRVVLYQVDPCSTNMTMTTALETRLAFERRMYERASSVLTTDIICEEQRRLLPGEIYQKFISMELPLVSEPTFTRGEVFPKEGGPVCLFSGLIYSGIRDPGYTLRLFEELTKDGGARLYFVGVTREELPAELRDLPAECYGRQSLERAQELMNGADVLVNIGNKMTNQVPSKIFDYISLGKPIVNVCKNRECPTLPYLEKYPYALNLFEEEELLEEQKARLAAFLRTHAAHRLPFDQVAERFMDCTPGFCAAQMLAAFQNDTKGPKEA